MPGIFSNTICPDARVKGPDSTAELIMQRLGLIQHTPRPKAEPLTPPNLEILHIESFDKSIIKDALTIYERQISEDEQVRLDDLIELIRRYLSGYYAPRFLLHFFVAVFDQQVVGMLICYEDTNTNFTFVPYAAALMPLRGLTNPHHITRQLGMELVKVRQRLNLPPLQLLFEADDPRLVQGEERRLRQGRIRLFDSLGASYEDLRVRALDIKYLQPNLQWPGEGPEREMVLFIARKELQPTMPQKEAIEILTWIYTELYSGKIFDPDQDARTKFREYTKGLLDLVVPTLPGSVQLLRCRNLDWPSAGSAAAAP